MARFSASLNRRDITASPVGAKLPYTSSLASNVFDAMTTGFNAYAGMRENDARDRLYNAQADGQILDNDAKRRQAFGNQILAGIISDAKGDPDLARKVVKAGLTNGANPEELAKWFTLLQANDPQEIIAGQTQEQTIVGNRAVFSTPLSEGQAFDVNRAQGILDRKDATERYRSDNQLAGTKYGADKSSGATIESARIRADGDVKAAGVRADSKGSTTTYTGFDKMPRKDFDAYVDDAIASVAAQGDGYVPSAKVRGVIAQRAEARMQAGEAPVSAAQNAAREVLTGQTDESGKTELVQPGILSKPNTPAPTQKTPRTKTVNPRSAAPAAPAAKPAAKPAAAKPATPKRPPQPGDVVNGYVFKGGALNDPRNWEPAGA